MQARGVVVVPDSTTWTGPWLGATRATSLQRVANRPIICHVLDALLEADVVETAVVAPADIADEIADCVEREGPAGTAVRHLSHDHPGESNDVLLAASEFVGDAPCILHRADGLLGQSIASLVELSSGRAPDVLLLARDEPSEAKRLRLVAQGSPSVFESDYSQHSSGLAGVCVLGPRLLGRLPNQGHCAQLLDFAAIAEQLGRDGGSTQVQSAPKWRHFSGDALDLLALNRTMLDMLPSETTASATDGNRFEGPVSIHPMACVTSSVIIGPVMIDADALISDSYIGPHTSIGKRVRIEGSELERSIVLADASVLHVGERLVTSIVGRHARIFRDFSVPRAMRLQVSDGDEVALC